MALPTTLRIWSAALVLCLSIGSGRIQTVAGQSDVDYNTYYTEQAEAQGETQEAARDDSFYNPKARPWINEFHYNNIGEDVDEFIEVAVPLTVDLNASNFVVVLYDGFYSRLYKSDAFHPLSTFKQGNTTGGVTFYNKRFPRANCSEASTWCGLQNGRDGFALTEYFTPTSGQVLEFWSYQGSFTAKDGPAFNMTSANIGVQETSQTPVGASISKNGIGCVPTDFTFQVSLNGTRGWENLDQSVVCTSSFINEFHYDNEKDGEGQFIEVASTVGPTDVVMEEYSVVLYSGEDGLPYDVIPLTAFTVGETDTEGLTFYYYDFTKSSGMTLMAVTTKQLVDDGKNETTMVSIGAGIALAKGEDVLDFISYGGNFTAEAGVAEGLTSVDVGIEETEDTPVGSSLQLVGEGCAAKNFEWEAVVSNRVDIDSVGDTRGMANVGQVILCVKTPPRPDVNATTGEMMEDETDDLMTGDDDFLGENVVIYKEEDGKDEIIVYQEGEPL